MKIEIRRIDDNLTYVGYFTREYCEYVELIKCYDSDMMGKRKSFWRVDDSWRTVSSLNRTKTQAIDFAKRYMKNKKEQRGK